MVVFEKRLDNQSETASVLTSLNIHEIGTVTETSSCNPVSVSDTDVKHVCFRISVHLKQSEQTFCADICTQLYIFQSIFQYILITIVYIIQ